MPKTAVGYGNFFRNMPYTINPKLSTCYIANVGMGKTMVMTYLHALPALEAGLKVVSDYKINWKGANLSYFTPEEFDEVCMTWRNCIVLIDEIGVILDSRQFKEEGSNTRRFFSYHRKHHVEIVASTQHISQVAKTSKNLVSDWFICSEISKSSLVMELFTKLIGYKGVIIKTERVELEELANEKQVLDPEAPLVFGTPEKAKTYWLNEKKLIRNDLKEYKEEQEYIGCVNCKTRFTEKDKEDTKDYTFCPLCMTHTIGKITAIMYDTDYELPAKSEPKKKVVFLKEVKKFESYIPTLTKDELEWKSKLEGVITNDTPRPKNNYSPAELFD